MAHQGMASTLEAPDMRAGYDNPEQVPPLLTYTQQLFRPGVMPTLSATLILILNVGIGCRGGCNESAEQRRLAGISPHPSVSIDISTQAIYSECRRSQFAPT